MFTTDTVVSFVVSTEVAKVDPSDCLFADVDKERCELGRSPRGPTAAKWHLKASRSSSLRNFVFRCLDPQAKWMQNIIHFAPQKSKAMYSLIRGDFHRSGHHCSWCTEVEPFMQPHFFSIDDGSVQLAS